MNGCSESSHQAPKRHYFNLSLYSNKKPRQSTKCRASISLKHLGLPLISKISRSPCNSLHLESYEPCTIGRSYSCCDFVFDDIRVSKTHCQILFDSTSKNIYLSDGLLFSCIDHACSSRARVSLNGVFVNQCRITKGELVELCVGDEVLLVYGNECDLKVGFVVERIVFVEDLDDGSLDGFHTNGTSIDYTIFGAENGRFNSKANILLSKCREILCSEDPISYISKSGILSDAKSTKHCRKRGLRKFFGELLSKSVIELSLEGYLRDKEVQTNGCLANTKATVDSSSKSAGVAPTRIIRLEWTNSNGSSIEKVYNTSVQCESGTTANGKYDAITSECPKKKTLECPRKEDISLGENGGKDKIEGSCPPPPGRKFYLNKLQGVDNGTVKSENVVSLPEIFYPVKSLVRVFIATFTSNIPWFLSYCEIPPGLPVTIACHDREKCWSSNPGKRISIPYSDFPHLVVVHPPFPETIAFGQDSKKSGIACHHPKLFLLQREDSLRVVITSANLVERQWLNVTNTIWWQDFPCLAIPDYVALFSQSSYADNNLNRKSDFAAHLAGFIASLLADVPSQAYWILELAKYNFVGALAHLVASVPGIHSARSPYMFDSKYYMHGNQHGPIAGAMCIGSVEASVVGLNYLFRSSADFNGKKLRKLAAFLGKCHENADGMTEVLLRREKNIPADANAVSILLPNPVELSGDCIQLGFLPRNCAKWVAALSDIGLFAFSAYVYPKEVLKAALEGSNNRVQLVLDVSQGPSFSEISEVKRVEHVSAVCSLVASIQRCVGLWRLQEVLCQYKWPEHLESEFIFGSSSVGSVNAHFLAAFSAAAGKRSVELTESEESDPDWGCWSASQELRKPSIRILFPTIERVTNASCGILASKYILCFSEKTWQRLKSIGILDDAVPYPQEREGFPMHVKVARRRFYSKRDDVSFGWVYCGSHNFSAAAWGRPFSNSVDRSASNMSSSSLLGSRLHVSNYELGIVFTVPPSDGWSNENEQCRGLDEINLPFVIPAPRYRTWDRPATAQAMREALAEVAGLERGIPKSIPTTGEVSAEEVPDEEDEIVEVVDFNRKEKEDERAYADKLWSQVDPS